VLERITDGFYALDREWRLTYVNPAAEQMLGQAQAQLLGRNVWDAFPPARETPLFAAFEQAMRDGESASLELYYPPSDGWFEARIYPSPDGLSVFLRDITASQIHEQELLASEAKYRTLVEQLPAAVYQLAPDAKQTRRYVSPYIEMLTGYTPDEFIDQSHHADWQWVETVHPGDRDRVADEDARCMAAGEPFLMEYRTARKDGGHVWVRDVCVPLRGVAGTIVAWQGVFLDITDRIQAEEMQARLAAIVEAAGDGILSVSEDGTIISWNRGAERIYGYTAAEAIGLSVAMLRPPDQAKQIARDVARVWAGEVIERHETLRLAKDGRQVPVSLSIFPIRDAQGHIIATSSITHDLTLLRQTQDALHVRNRALDATQNGMLITNPTLPDNPIVDVNPAFTAVTGYSRREVLGRNCRLLQGPATDPEAVRRLREAIADGRDITETLLNYRKDGTPFWNELSVAAVRDKSGVLTHFVGVQTDVSERIHLEHELRAALEEAQAGMRAKTRFLAMMSHELRTPLQAVLGYADFLLSDAGEPLSLNQLEDIGAIRHGAERMVSLIGQLLDLSRLEAGRQELATGAVDLRQVLDQVRQDIAPQAAANKLRLQMLVPRSLPAARGDLDGIRQILLNLVGNAVKFTEQGAITVRVCRRKEWLGIAVKDTGIGIAQEALTQIFEEFQQVDSRLNRRYGGTGLGLAISQRLAEQMGGRISVTSTPGVGSTFTLWLPIATP
jgi:PAS domain S-box-containing protein